MLCGAFCICFRQTHTHTHPYVSFRTHWVELTWMPQRAQISFSQERVTDSWSWNMSILTAVGFQLLTGVPNRAGTIPVWRYSLVSWQGNKTQSGFNFFRKFFSPWCWKQTSLWCHPESHVFISQVLEHNMLHNKSFIWFVLSWKTYFTHRPAESSALYRE